MAAVEDGPDAPGERNYRFQKAIVALGAALMAVKFAAWAATGSVSVLTDALESIANVAAGLVGLYALHLSKRPRDSDHPFGHGRAEVISSTVEGVMIAAASATISAPADRKSVV